MNYSKLRYLIKKTEERTRAVKNLIQLRHQLDRSVPAKDAEDNLLLSTFNIRDLGKRNRRGWGKRLPESWFYIAETISRFDFVAVQEVNELDEWQKIMSILGPDWSYIATDETDPMLGGNGERMTFVYDNRKVRFQSIAGEIVLPPNMLISSAQIEIDGKKVKAGNQFKRTPFIASFQSGWLKFDICTVHLYFGANYGEKLDQRVEEIGTIAKYLATRADRALGDDRALFLLGDFNIVSPEHRTMKALTAEGFKVPQALRDKPTTGTEKYYDQIAFKTKPEVLEYVESRSADPLKRNAGVVKLFEKVFTDNEFDAYKSIVKTKTTAGKKATTQAQLKKAYQNWRTYQFSDHYPMWVRLKTDNSQAYLSRFL
ncbi:endonuclease/exonuclease/phosphatase family [Verrucomicrobiia bacterium DG1235]|nr:endonuclease/exonuclease/phosphatase family [Verrucomicrobiae bacterium DG1235]